MKRIVLTQVDGLGWQPTIEVFMPDTEKWKPVYRGEYQPFGIHAFDKADDAYDRLYPEKVTA